MRRLPLAVTALLVTALPAAAQQQQGRADPTTRVAGGALPAGWRVRLDDKDAARYKPTDAKFFVAGTGYHVTSGPAALYYDPKDRAPGNTFVVTAELTQTRAPAHPEAYGLFLGGKHLDASDRQDYAYFLVRGTGEFMLTHRAGRELHTIIPWTRHAAVKAADASGRATNQLTVRVGADSARFLVNGTQVAAVPRDHWKDASGIVGLRVNHDLDVHVEKFAVTK